LVERLLAQILELLGGILPEREHRLMVTHHPAFLPLDLQPGRITQRQVESAALGEDIGEFQLPVQEGSLGSELLGQLQTRKSLEQLVEVNHTEPVDELPTFGLVLGGRQQFELGFLALGREDIAEQEGFQLGQEIVAVGQLRVPVHGPEPQRAPVVHGQLQATIGSGVLLVFSLQLASQRLVLEIQAGVLAFGVASEHAIGVRGAPAQPGQALGVLGPELVDARGNPLQARDLAAVEGLGELGPPLGDGLDLVAEQLFGHLVAVAGHASVGQQEVPDPIFRALVA